MITSAQSSRKDQGMMSRRVVVSLLLFVAILPVADLTLNTPETHTQAFTTITSYITTPKTVTSVRVVVVSTTSTTTFTRSDTTTSSLAQPKKLFSETIALRPPPSRYGCQVDYDRAFTAKKGQVVSVNTESESEFSLYIMSEKDYRNWQKKGKCSPGEVSDFTGAFGVTSYSEQIVIRNDGAYRFIFLNFGTSTIAIQFKAEVVGTAHETTSVVTSRVVSHEYSTEIMTLTTMATGMLVRTEEVGFSLVQNSLVVIAVVVLVIISIVVATILQRRRREKPVAMAEAGVFVESQPAVRRLCPNCGAELVTEDKFCTNCGSPTS